MNKPEIINKEESFQDTQNKINEIRGQLGLPLSDEIPSYIKNSQKYIETNKKSDELIKKILNGVVSDTEVELKEILKEIEDLKK